MPLKQGRFDSGGRFSVSAQNGGRSGLMADYGFPVNFFHAMQTQPVT
jgi:hypothetical protein